MRFDDRHEVVVTGPWTAEMVAAVESGVADRVVLNHALGFEEPDLRFLEHLPVRELVVLDRRIADLSPVYTLAPTLERLDLTIDDDVRIDLSELPHLRSLSAPWSQVSDTIAAAQRLGRLAVDAYRPHDLTPLAGLRGLTTLSMKGRPRLRSLDGLSELVLLEHLGVFLAVALDDIVELRGREFLRRLDLQACRRVRSVDDLSGCTGLQVLNLAEGADLESARPLGALIALEELYVYGSTRFVDGDLSPIAALPHLTELRIQSRRHYRPTTTQVKTALALRAASARGEAEPPPPAVC